jgi:ferrous iron transport protein A
VATQAAVTPGRGGSCRPDALARADHSAIPAAKASVRLADLPPKQRARILRLTPPPARPEWARLLADIGFEAGEPVQVLRRAAVGGDPIVVRIGASTFALRRAEADCVEVELAA